MADAAYMLWLVNVERRARTEHAPLGHSTIVRVNPTRLTSRHKHPSGRDKDLEIHDVFVDLSV